MNKDYHKIKKIYNNLIVYLILILTHNTNFMNRLILLLTFIFLNSFLFSQENDEIKIQSKYIVAIRFLHLHPGLILIKNIY